MYDIIVISYNCYLSYVSAFRTHTHTLSLNGAIKGIVCLYRYVSFYSFIQLLFQNMDPICPHRFLIASCDI